VNRLAAAFLALAFGTASCSGGGTSQPKEHLVFDVNLELRYQATVDVSRDGQNLEVALVPQASFDVLEIGRRYDGRGFLEEFPEAHTRLYTAGFDAPAMPSGPCGQKPVSLALSLSRRDQETSLSGSLTAFCGAGVFTGTPTRIFRLAGKIRSS